MNLVSKHKINYCCLSVVIISWSVFNGSQIQCFLYTVLHGVSSKTWVCLEEMAGVSFLEPSLLL